MKPRSPKILWVSTLVTLITPLCAGNHPGTATYSHKGSDSQIVRGVLTVKHVLSAVNADARIKSDKLGNYYLLNPQDHSIVLYDNQLRFVRRIGQIGQGLGEFYYPQDFAIGQKGLLYVADSDNNRVQVVDPNGAGLQHFRFPQPLSIAPLSSGEILVVGRADDQLIRVFSPEGRLLKTIGTPVDVGVKNPKLSAYLNRGWLFVDQSDNIYYLFRALLDPTVRKYNPDGKLLMEIHPRGTEMKEILSRAKAQLQETVRKGELGFSATLNAVGTDPATGNIWIAPSGPVLYVYTAQGHMLAEYRLRDSVGSFHGAIDFTLVGGSRGCFVNPAGGFLFNLPKKG